MSKRRGALLARGVSGRIIWTVLGLCTVLVGATTAISVRTVRHALLDRLIEQGSVLSTVCADLLTVPMFLEDAQEIDSLAATLLRADPDVTEMVCSYGDLPADWLSREPWSGLAATLEPDGRSQVFRSGALYILSEVAAPGEAPVGTMGLVLSSERIEHAILRLTASLVAVSVLLLAASVVFLVSMLRHRIQRPLRETMEVLARLADGDISHRLEAKGDDEFGRMAGSLNAAIDAIAGTVRAITENSHNLADASTALSGLSQALVVNAESAAGQAQNVAAGGADTSRGVQSVANAIDGLNSSIQEIATNASQAARIARSAVDTAEEANQTISRLNESGSRIGNIIKVITTIAEQTNLLALNATIEASRAGDAGRGFSVVANEVKGLATQTAAATGRIGEQVHGLQEDAENAVAAIHRVAEVIGQISNLQTSIAGAVEEQNAASTEIRYRADASGKTASGITDAASALVDAAGSTSTAASEAREMADRLAGMAARLREEVQRFRI